jgi:predicted ArsR family transcriptional regulator
VPGDNRPREIRDPRVLRGVAHPVRLALLELIGREGKLTATVASELSGESVASCSFHLRQLAKYGLIEEAPGGAGREKPWRLVASGHSWDEVEDSDRAIAGRVLTSVLAARELELFEEWLDRRREEPKAWQKAAMTQQSLLYLSPAELSDLSEAIDALLADYMDRLNVEKRPRNARPVRLFSIGYPIRPTKHGN